MNTCGLLVPSVGCLTDINLYIVATTATPHESEFGGMARMAIPLVGRGADGDAQVLVSLPGYVVQLPVVQAIQQLQLICNPLKHQKSA